MRQVTSNKTEQLTLFEVGVDMGKLRQQREDLSTWKRARNTQIGYQSDWKIFTAWCEQTGRNPIPATPDTISFFATHQLEMEGLKVSTVVRRLTSIKYIHKTKGHDSKHLVDQQCRDVLMGARRQRKEKTEAKRALKLESLRKICGKLGQRTNADIRDRAILVLGFASGLRRSELAALDLADIEFCKKGLIIDIGSSKADQEGKGRSLGVFQGKRALTDPVRTLREWIRRRGRFKGPLFTRIQTGDTVTQMRIAGESINDLVQRCVRRIGLDPTQYGAHSLRAGLVTAAADNGATDQEIMRASGHASIEVMRQYVRHARAFPNRNPLAGAL